MDPVTILSALLPMLVQGGKAAINKWLGSDNFKPTNIDEYKQIKSTELELFKAINTAGGNNQSYPWVEAIVRLQRPVVVVGVLLAWVYVHFVGETLDTSSIDNMVSVVGFYLFGERSMFYLNKKRY